VFSVFTSESFAGFDWGTGCDGEQGGSGTFQQQIQHYAGDYENAVTVGTIPSGITNVYISLTSDEDVDIRIYDAYGTIGTPVVHWPNGILNGESVQSAEYNGIEIEYSGYNGDGTGLGHEYITIIGTTQNAFIMKAFGYMAGYAQVDYSWEGREANQSCDTPAENGAGTFQQQIQHYAGDFENAVTVGTIPSGITDVYISLISDEDVDIRIYDTYGTLGTLGTPVVHWPNGILNGGSAQFAEYNGIELEYSGFNGDGTGLGHEYIKIIGTTQNDFIMKAFGYMAGDATVNYSWGHLWHPCSSCGYPEEVYEREWHGDDTNHLAQDYPAFVGDSVRAVADGQVYRVYSSIDGFGGFNPITEQSRNGPAIVVRHKKRDGSVFFALYGHTSSNVTEGEFVRGNQVIGTVQDYLYGPEDNIQHWPHLHFGIWDAEDNFPTVQLGYGPDRDFIDPVHFLENTQYQAWTE
jgi:murein DD-endopeptidase MepM/ murein hydrolase activator NlpD